MKNLDFSSGLGEVSSSVNLQYKNAVRINSGYLKVVDTALTLRVERI